jgi:hypothetical protein
MFCTSATLTATAFPSPSPPRHFLCTSHISITRFPAPSLTSPTDSHMLSWLRCAQFGTFDVLTRGLRAFHLSICLSGGMWETPHAVLAKGPKSTPIFYWLLQVTVHHPKTQQKHIPTTESTRYPHCNRLTSAHFAKFRVALLICYPQSFAKVLEPCDSGGAPIGNLIDGHAAIGYERWPNMFRTGNIADYA